MRHSEPAAPVELGRRRGQLPLLLLAVGAIAVVATIELFVIANALAPSAAVPSAASSGQAPEALVRGVTSPPSTDDSGANGTTAPIISETFDDLAMDDALGEPWEVEGDARIVALPTSVDRSVRLVSAGDGEATRACRDLPEAKGAKLSVALELMLGTIPSTPSPLIDLRSGDTAVARLAVDGTGALVAQEPSENETSGNAAPGTAAPPAWTHVDLSIDTTSGAVSWTAERASDGATAEGTINQGADGSTIDSICIVSPVATPSGWVAVDELTVSE